jgi:hypothetical protein
MTRPGLRKVRIRTNRHGLASKPTIDGVPLDDVTKVEITIDATSLPVVTFTVFAEPVFNGMAFVRVRDLDLDPGLDARREFINALNAADLEARRRGRPEFQRRLPDHADTSTLVKVLDEMGWGFYRRKG